MSILDLSGLATKSDLPFEVKVKKRDYEIKMDVKKKTA
jgi:hypothetical protein